jgi:SCF-associated factor 1
VLLAHVEGSVTSVHAGWDRSSALVRGYGIVLWDILRNGNVTEYEENDYVIVPKTGYQQPRGSARAFPEPDSPETTVGEVTSYVVLEHYVLFTTHLRKVFAYRMRHDSEAGVMHDIFELTDLSDAKDVQGAFRSFAVFCGEGKVYISNQDYLDACSRRAFQQHDDPLPELILIPAMQNTGVMQVAFGDYHYHALHSDGTISSYGHESGGCGALGLGGAMDLVMPHGVLRGIKTNGWTHDGVLLPHAYSYGRRVWFQEEKKEWIRFLANGGRDCDEAKPRLQQINMMPIAQAYMSEWVEQNGTGWEKRPEVQKIDEDGLGAYFALSVAAAGWHSGALVLVNDKVVDAVRESCLETIPDAIPSASENLMLAGGRSGSSLWNIAKSFLGLQVTSDTESGSSTASTADQRPQQHEDGSPPKGKRWIWANQDFPRLLLDYNFMAPGTIQHSKWIPPEGIRRFLYTQDERRVFGVPGWAREDSESFVAP